MEKHELKPSEAKKILTYIVKNNIELAKDGKKPNAIELEGPAGVAKTSMSIQVAEDLGMNYIKLNAAQLETTGDITGYPTVEVEVCNEAEECRWVLESAVRGLLVLGYKPTGNTRMAYAKPEYIVGKEDTPCVFIIDDSKRSLPMLQQAIMEIADRGESLTWSLPKGSTVVLTNNPSDDGDFILSSDVDSAHKSRYLTFNVRPSAEDWAIHEQNSLPQYCIDFILSHPEIIESNSDEKNKKIIKANSRTWTKFFNALYSLKDLKKNWSMVHLIGSGDIPTEHLTLFQMFVENQLHKLPTPKKVLTSKNIEEDIKELESIVGERSDLKALMSKRFFSFCIRNIDLVNDNEIIGENYIKLIEDSKILQDDILMYTVKELNHYFDWVLNSKRAQEIIGINI